MSMAKPNQNHSLTSLRHNFHKALRLDTEYHLWKGGTQFPTAWFSNCARWDFRAPSLKSKKIFGKKKNVKLDRHPSGGRGRFGLRWLTSRSARGITRSHLSFSSTTSRGVAVGVTSILPCADRLIWICTVV